jgi:D-lyxose ketol-isomerase
LRRSEINNIMRVNIEFLKNHQYYLPKFAFWSIEDWRSKGKEIKEIIDHQLGWDITDLGTNIFYNTVYKSTEKDELSDKSFAFYIDGTEIQVKTEI